MRRRFWSLLFVTQVVGAVACSADADRSDLRAAVERTAAVAPAVDASAAAAAAADQVEIVSGVPNRNRDPAVVAVANGQSGLCTGTLISPRLVLTARRCTSRTVSAVACPPTGVQVLGDHSPSSLAILVGDDVASAHLVAHGEAVVAPSGATLCEADIAIIVLDRPVKTAKPLPVSVRGAARGERVRAVGFGRTGDGAAAGTKLVREHVRVLSVSASEFTVGEATCSGNSGGPALDEDTSEIVGVVSRGGPTCEGANVHNVYTRADAFSWLVDEAFAKVAGLDRDGPSDAGAPVSLPPKGTKQKPPSDMGGPCEQAAECAAGVCITDPEGKYCSRPCGTGDRCPPRYRCEPITGPSGSKACLNVK